jgi:hypothetical protein
VITPLRPYSLSSSALGQASTAPSRATHLNRRPRVPCLCDAPDVSASPPSTPRPGPSTTPPMHAALVAAWCRYCDGRAVQRVVVGWCAVGGASCGGPRVEGEECSDVEGEERQERACGRRRGCRRGGGPRGVALSVMMARHGVIEGWLAYLRFSMLRESCCPEWRSSCVQRWLWSGIAASRGATGVGALTRDKKLRPSPSNISPTIPTFPQLHT